MSRVFAHRGLSASYPENTILAFGKALDAGGEGIELDVQLSRDGELVIIHDETIDRTTDGKGKVRDFSFEELRRFDASGRFAGGYGREIRTHRQGALLVVQPPVSPEMQTDRAPL